MKSNKSNLKITPIKSEVNQERNLKEFAVILKRAILDWEYEMRSKTNNKYFDGYEELARLVNLHPQTIRKYVNEFDLITPTVHHLIMICNAINNRTPIEFISDYSKHLINQ